MVFFCLCRIVCIKRYAKAGLEVRSKDVLCICVHVEHVGQSASRGLQVAPGSTQGSVSVDSREPELAIRVDAGKGSRFWNRSPERPSHVQDVIRDAEIEFWVASSYSSGRKDFLVVLVLSFVATVKGSSGRFTAFEKKQALVVLARVEQSRSLRPLRPTMSRCH